MSKAKQIASKGLIVESVEVRIAGGLRFQLKAADVERLCTVLLRRQLAEEAGRPMPKTKMDREAILLERVAQSKKNWPILDIVCAVIRTGN